MEIVNGNALPLNLMKWIEEHEAVLGPPVGNAQVWEDGELRLSWVDQTFVPITMTTLVMNFSINLKAIQPAGY